MLIKYLLYINLLCNEIITQVVIDFVYIYPNQINKIAHEYNFPSLHDGENTINIRTIINLIYYILYLNNFNDFTLNKIYNIFNQIEDKHNIKTTNNNKIRFLLTNKEKIYKIFLNNSPKDIEKKYLNILFEIIFMYYIMIELFPEDISISNCKQIINQLNPYKNYYIYNNREEPFNENQIVKIINNINKKKPDNNRKYWIIKKNKIYSITDNEKKNSSSDKKKLFKLGIVSRSIPIEYLDM